MYLRIRLSPKLEAGNEPIPAEVYSLRPISFLASVSVHGAALVLLSLFSGNGNLHRPAEADKPILSTHKVIYYKLRKKVPDVSPASNPDSRTQDPRGLEISKRSVIATSPQADSKKQLIWLPEASIRIPDDVAAPDIISRLKMSLPTPAPPKEAPPATADNAPPQSNQADRPKPKAFTPPPAVQQERPAPVILDTIPALAIPSAIPADAGVAGLHGSISAPSAPPASGSTVRGNGQFDLAVANAEPVAGAAGAIPAGARGGQFSKAPNLGPPSAGAPGGEDLRVPDLTIREDSSKPAPVAKAPERPAILYTERVRSVPLSSLSVPLRPSSRSIPRAVESRFQGRSVYALVVPIENLPAYDGDWILWFAERDPKVGETPVVRAPVPFRKLEIAGQIVAESRMTQRIQVTGLIEKSGKIGRILIVTPVPAALQQDVVRDLTDWEFKPATRNGVPVDVEVFIEIPFKLPVAMARREPL